MATQNQPEIRGPMQPGYETVLTPAALQFVADLARRFGDRVTELLAARATWQKRLDDGALPDFLPETAEVRKAQWRVTTIPADLQDRRVEITGPTDRKMVINALNSGAKVFMADCEDSLTPTWDNVVQGQINLRDAVTRDIAFANPDGKQYRLNPQTATLLVRPRGWHLYEKHMSGRRQAGARRVRRLRLVPVPQPRCIEGARHGAVLLSAQARESPRGAAVGRRAPAFRNSARHRAADHQGHGADRNDSRRVRDGRDPARAQGLHRRLELRPLGLHLQLHQEVQPPAGVRAAGPPAGDDDDALPALVLEAAHQDLPPPRRFRDGRHGAADSDQERPEGQRGSAWQGARGQGARGWRRPRRHVGGAPRSRADRDGNLRPADADAEPVAQDTARTSRSARATCCRFRRARSPRPACAATSASPSSTSPRGSAGSAACRSTT